MSGAPRTIAARQRAVRRALAKGAMRRSELLAATRIKATLLTYTLRTLGDAIAVHPHPRGNLYALAGSLDAMALMGDEMPEQEPITVQRDYRIEAEELAPGHRRVRFGDRWRPARAQRADTALAAGASSLGGLYL